MAIELNFPAPLLAQAHSSRPALLLDKQAVTYQQLRTAAARWAAWYRLQGIQTSQIVALVGPPSLDLIVHLHALAWLGATAMPLAPRATPSEILRLAHLAQPALVVATRGSSGAHRAVLEQACRLVDHSASDALVLDDLPPALAARQWLLSDRLLLLATSGTTAEPQLIALAWHQLLFSAMGSAMRLGHLPDDVWLLALPLHHVGGLSILWRAVLGGTTISLMPQFDARQAARMMAQGDVALVSLVPTMLAQICEVWPQDSTHSRLRAVLVGGAAARPAVVSLARSLGLPVALTWGMTQTASQVATRFCSTAKDVHNVGAALPFCQVSVEHGQAVGRLKVCGATVTAPLVTDDVGSVDAQGQVHVLGRADDLIISGGENVLPEEIEARLMQHPCIADAAVVGRQDVVWGQRPVAFVVAHAKEPVPQPEDLAAFCRATLASFKVPVQFIWQASLPRDALGKLRRRSLRVQQQGQPAIKASRRST